MVHLEFVAILFWDLARLVYDMDNTIPVSPLVEISIDDRRIQDTETTNDNKSTHDSAL
jgi:hypothetical protein